MAMSEKQLDTICDSLSGGASLRATCATMGLAESSVRRWISDDPDIMQRIVSARDLGYDALADQCIEIADTSDLDPQDRRVRIDTRLRLLGKWSRRYAERSSIDVGNREGETLRIDAAVDTVSLVLHLAEALRQQDITLLPEPDTAIPELLDAPAPALPRFS